jgi:hypothetical protein
MLHPEGIAQYGAMTVIEAESILADQSRLAAFYADRVEQARAAGEPARMSYWTDEYRRSARRCRLLGEVIRARGPRAHRPRRQASNVIRLGPPRPSADASHSEEVA